MHRAWAILMALVLLGASAAAARRIACRGSRRCVRSCRAPATRPPADVDAGRRRARSRWPTRRSSRTSRPAAPSRRPTSSRSVSRRSCRPGAARASACTVSRPGGATGALTVGVFARARARRLVAPCASTGAAATGRSHGSRRSRTTACPELHRWPAARDGAPQFVATWFGAASGRGGRPLAVEVWRGGGDGVERLWTSSTPFPDGLSATAFAVKNGTIAIRYEPAYPGWKPGCDRQTEHVDFYRPDARRPGAGAEPARCASNAGIATCSARSGRLLDALASGDTRAVRALVPDRALAARLPRALGREPACDEAASGLADDRDGGGDGGSERRDRAVVAHVASDARRLAAGRCDAHATMTARHE